MQKNKVIVKKEQTASNFNATSDSRSRRMETAKLGVF